MSRNHKFSFAHAYIACSSGGDKEEYGMNFRQKMHSPPLKQIKTSPMKPCCVCVCVRNLT